MTDKLDITPTVRSSSELPFDRLWVIQRLADFELSEIRRAVVFIFAAWSAPSILALRKFTHLLATLDLGSLDVIILDIDCMTGGDTIRLFGHVFHGWGETLWFRDGRVFAEVSAYGPESESLILTHTRELLK